MSKENDYQKQVFNILFLSKSDVVSLGGDSSSLYIDAVSQALILHSQGKVVQPLKPYIRWDDSNGHIADRIIAMPALIKSESPIAGIKWIGSKHTNPKKHGLDRASAIIILNDPETNYPLSILEGSMISGMRTGAVTAIAARYLGKSSFSKLSCIGCGVIGNMQILTLLEQFHSILQVKVFDINPNSMHRTINELKSKFDKVSFQIGDSAEEVIRSGEVVIISTITQEPYVQYEWLSPGTFVSNVSLMDVNKDVYLKVDKVIVDDWDQSNREKKIINQLVKEGLFSRQKLHAELGEIVAGIKPGRETAEEIILLNPMGMAIEDISCAQVIYQRALERNVGTWLNLF